ncbi:MAG: zinc-binding dehydrogenase, partial [Planctomycetota bacterium]
TVPRGCHVGYAIANHDDCFAVPAGIDPAGAAMARVASIGHRAARRSMPRGGEQVAVVGLGLIGLSAAMTLSTSGARVVGFNRSPDRVELARRCGVEAYRVDSDLGETVKRYLPGGADVLVDATGNAEMPVHAVEAIRDLDWTDGSHGSARYVVLGSVNDNLAVPYFPSFYRELTMEFPRYTDNTDAREVLNLLDRGVLDFRPLLENTATSPRDAQAAYDALADRKSGLITAVFDWTRLHDETGTS